MSRWIIVLHNLIHRFSDNLPLLNHYRPKRSPAALRDGLTREFNALPKMLLLHGMYSFRTSARTPVSTPSRGRLWICDL